MIKKTLHFVCVTAAGGVWSALLLLLYWQLFMLVYQFNILSPRTYQMFSAYWNGGGTLKGGDIFMILGIVSYLPICFFGWRWLSKVKYLNIIIKPITWLSNIGLGKYSNGMPEVNLKNLKIEEKKTIEQVVKERIEQENKKNPQADAAGFRKEIVDKIENELS